MPPLPGAQKSFVMRGDCASFQTSACSRPPPPRTRTFIGAKQSRVGGRQDDVKRWRPTTPSGVENPPPVPLISSTLRCPGLLCFWAFVFACLRPCYAGNRSEPLLVVQNGLYGYIDQDGKVVIQPQFLWARGFWRGLGTVYVCGRYASIDSSGALLPLRIAVVGRFEPEKKGEKFGFIDSSGWFRIAPNFD